MSYRKPFRAVPIRPAPRYRNRRIRWYRKRNWQTAGLGLVVFATVFLVGMTITNWPLVSSVLAASRTSSPHFELCGLVRSTCVVDGDTFWFEGHKIRIADIDTPEISEPQCDSEYRRGMQATYRLRELLNEGPFDLKPIGGRDKDQYGRDLRIVVRNGRSLGDQLVREGLARTWTGRREPWC